MTEILERLCLHLSRFSAQTQYGYLWWSRQFVGQHPDPSTWTPETLLRYLQDLKDQGYKPGSCQRAAFALKKLYTVAERPVPDFRWALSAADLLAQERPSLSQVELVAIIRAAASAPWIETTVFCALATTYGVRSCEMASMRPEYLRLREGQVVFPTAKREEARVHAIPESIRPLLSPEHFTRRRSSTEMWSWWRDLERRAGIPRRNRQGWHSVRRGLVATLLDAGIPERILEPWMGWGVRSMVARYSLRAREDLDRVVFERHPLVPIWADVLGGSDGR